MFNIINIQYNSKNVKLMKFNYFNKYVKHMIFRSKYIAIIHLAN